MTVTGQNFEIYQGDTKNVIISVTDENDAPLNLAGFDINWVIYRQTTKELILSKTIGGGITVPDPSSGNLIISLLPEDTESVVPMICNHECEISTGPEDVSTVTTGIVKILFSKA